jgi:outer membrane protein assembly factor BamB
MLAFDAATGAALWTQPLEGFVSTCPVVTHDAVFYASEAGNVARLGHDGSVQWKKAIGTRVTGQPVSTATQLLVPTEAGLKILRAADGEPDDRFRPPTSMTGRAVAVLPYGNKLAVLSGTASSYQNEGRAYAKYDGYFVVLTPKPAPAEAAK